MVVFDTSILSLAFDNFSSPPIDPGTGMTLAKPKERIDFLIATLSKAKKQILIPTPVLAEYLVNGGPDKSERLSIFTSSKVYQVLPFDIRAAVECSQIEDGDTKKTTLTKDPANKAKVKFDRQIIAIAKAARATTIYTGDKRLAHVAQDNQIAVVMTWELPLPPDDGAQLKMVYETRTP